MQFRVYGIKADTGKAVKPIVLSAPTEDAALARVRKAGVLVERIETVEFLSDAIGRQESAEASSVPSVQEAATATPERHCLDCGTYLGFITGRHWQDGSRCTKCGEKVRDAAAGAARQKATDDQARAKQEKLARLTVGPPVWRYIMVQIPTYIPHRPEDQGKGSAATYLARLVNEYSSLGWEFYRIDEVGEQVTPGCLAALFGARTTNLAYYVVTFRAPAEAKPAEPYAAADGPAKPGPVLS